MKYFFAVGLFSRSLARIYNPCIHGTDYKSAPARKMELSRNIVDKEMDFRELEIIVIGVDSQFRVRQPADWNVLRNPQQQLSSDR
jgi:hypothetical protein